MPRDIKKTVGQKAEAKGRRAECIAAFFLRLKGYQVLKYRYKNPLGEIDLILKKGRTIIFCEVKTRASLEKGLEALTFKQQRRLIKGAQHFQSHTPQFSEYDYRFDYMIVKGFWCYHIQNAWQV